MIELNPVQVSEIAKELAPIYNAWNWHWGDKIPQQKDIEREIYELWECLQGEKFRKGVTVSSGGLVVAENEEYDYPIITFQKQFFLLPEGIIG